MGGGDQFVPELAGLLRRAEGGDAAALPGLRAALGPASQVWRAYGDLASQLERELIGRAAGGNLLLAESLAREVERHQRELAGGSTSPLVVLLAGRAALGWLEAHYLDLLAAQGQEGGGEAAELGRRRDRAQRRYLAALESLALVKKLLR